MADYTEGALPSGDNKYAYLLRMVSREALPYAPPPADSGARRMDVGAAVTGVVDNLDDMYTSVEHEGNVQRKRFYMQRYTRGASMLESTRSPAGVEITRRVPVAKNDPIAVKGIITLPKSAVRFSRVTLPGTDIATRAGLGRHFIPYWDILSRKTALDTVVVSSAEPSRPTQRTYLKHVT